MKFNGIELTKGVWHDERSDNLMVITYAEVRSFINIKTFKESRDWAINCYIPGHDKHLRGVRLANYDHLVLVGKW